MTDNEQRTSRVDDGELPDAAQFWRWAGKATRPYAGWGLIALGAIFIIVGYLGVSREALVAKQLPYLVSGGIGGMVLVAVGAFLLGTDDLRRELRRLDDIERKVADLHGALLRARDTEPSVNGSPARSSSDAAPPASPAAASARRRRTRAKA